MNAADMKAIEELETEYGAEAVMSAVSAAKKYKAIEPVAYMKKTLADWRRQGRIGGQDDDPAKFTRGIHGHAVIRTEADFIRLGKPVPPTMSARPDVLPLGWTYEAGIVRDADGQVRE